MAENVIRMPKLGLTMEEGEIVEWHVRPGDKVDVGDAIVTVGSDKAESVLDSPYSGSVREICLPEGEVCAVGAVLCVLDSAHPVA